MSRRSENSSDWLQSERPYNEQPNKTIFDRKSLREAVALSLSALTAAILQMAELMYKILDHDEPAVDE